MSLESPTPQDDGFVCSWALAQLELRADATLIEIGDAFRAHLQTCHMIPERAKRWAFAYLAEQHALPTDLREKARQAEVRRLTEEVGLAFQSFWELSAESRRELFTRYQRSVGQSFGLRCHLQHLDWLDDQICGSVLIPESQDTEFIHALQRCALLPPIEAARARQQLVQNSSPEWKVECKRLRTTFPALYRLFSNECWLIENSDPAIKDTLLREDGLSEVNVEPTNRSVTDYNYSVAVEVSTNSADSSLYCFGNSSDELTPVRGEQLQDRDAEQLLNSETSTRVKRWSIFTFFDNALDGCLRLVVVGFLFYVIFLCAGSEIAQKLVAIMRYLFP